MSSWRSRRPTPGAARTCGVVAWADLLDPGVADRVAALRSGPGGAALVGLRTQVQAEADPAYLDRADARRGTAAAGTAARLTAWERDLAELAARPNVTAKLSGLVTEARWDAWRPDDLRPAVDHALEVFGPDRLMFGSDWPVCLLASGYGEWMATLGGLLAGLGEDESAAVWAGTARRVYQLEERHA